MNKRTGEVLKRLAQQTGIITIEQLAKIFHVTERTIRNDIAEINSFLRKNQHQEISILKDGTLCPGSDIKETLSLKIEQDIYTYRLSKEERMNISMILLINANPSVTINELSEQLQVSRATVTHELNDIKEALAKHGLRVVTYSNKGLYVEGSEMLKREVLYRLIWKMADTAQAADIRFPHYPGVDFDQILSPEERRTICRLINEQEHLQDTFFTDESFSRLQCYLMVAMQRSELGMLLEPQPMAEIRYAFAKELLSSISPYSGLIMSEDEVRALSRFLETLRYVKKKANPEIIRIQMVTRRFIMAVSETMQISLTTDLHFYEDLSNHLTSILQTHVTLEENSEIAKITDDYPEIYRAVHLHKNILEECCGRSLTKIELEYIVVHICTAVERIANNQRKLSVVLVCGSGVATSRLLFEKLSQRYHVIGMFSSHDMTSIQNCGADLIVSTIELGGIQTETVLVTPMLTEEDSLKLLMKSREIRKHWNQILTPKATQVKQPKQLLRDIQLIIREETQEEGPLFQRVSEALIEYFGLHEGDIVLLHQLLLPELIQLDVECRSWRQAIELSARPLLERNYINVRYIDRIFDIIAQNGPYMVMAKGLLVAHASFRDGVNRMGMNLIRLAAPIDFGEEAYQKDIRYVCCLSPVDSSSHLQALMNLTNLFCDQGFRSQIDHAADSRAVYDLICRYEQQGYFERAMPTPHA